MRMQFLLVVLLVACGGGAEAPAEVSQSPCEQVREHMIDLRLASAAKIDREAHREAMRRALGEDFLTSCRETMTDSEIRCVLEARDSLATVACSTKVSAK